MRTQYCTASQGGANPCTPPPTPPGSPPEGVRIIYPPTPRSVMVPKGQRLVLECVASGVPPPRVTWAKDGADLPLANTTRFLLSNLLIDAAAEADSGTYACRADSGPGPASSSVRYHVQVTGEWACPPAPCLNTGARAQLTAALPPQSPRR